jgi:hypothetical protein
MGWQRWSTGIAKDEEMMVGHDSHGLDGWGWRMRDMWGEDVLTVVKKHRPSNGETV